MEDVVEKDASLPKFILSDLFKLLYSTSQTKFDPSKLSKWWQKKLDEPLVDFIKRWAGCVQFVQDYSGVPFFAKLRNVLLWDGIPLMRLNRTTLENTYFDTKRNKGAWYLHLHSNGTLVSKSKHWHHQWTYKIPKELNSQSLETLLQLEVDTTDATSTDATTTNATLTDATTTNATTTNATFTDAPLSNTHQQLVDWLQQYGLLGKVFVRYCTGFYKDIGYDVWIDGSDERKKRNPGKTFVIYAYRNKENGLSFSSVEPWEQKQNQKHDTLKRKRQEKQQSLINSQTDNNTMIPNAFDHNRSSSVSVALQSLTLGIKLGLLTKQEGENLVDKLSLSVLGFWFHFNSQDQVCHVTLQDGLGFKQNFEILACKKSEDDNEHAYHTEKEYLTWKKVFDCMWERRTVLMKYKQDVLQPFLIEQSPRNQTRQKPGSVEKFYSDLKACQNRFKVITFSKDDKTLHALKVNLTHYIFTLQKKGVEV